MTPSPPSPGLALLLGASGGIGSALADALRADSRHAAVMACCRDGGHAFDLEDEQSIVRLAASVAAQELPLRLVICATGTLTRHGGMAEKSWKQIEPEALARAFAINAIGPALLMKHLLPLLPRQGRSVFAALSARVGSIGDNRLGGWYGYRASKAALNQLVHTAAIELKRSHPEAVCVALHPGTVDTPLSRGFTRSGLEVQQPAVAARRLLAVLHALEPAQSGGFFDHHGRSIAW